MIARLHSKSTGSMPGQCSAYQLARSTTQRSLSQPSVTTKSALVICGASRLSSDTHSLSVTEDRTNAGLINRPLTFNPIKVCATILWLLRLPVAAVRHSPGVTALSRDPYLADFRPVHSYRA